jgi:transcriptional regulator with XRE-family HTH domain
MRRLHDAPTIQADAEAFLAVFGKGLRRVRKQQGLSRKAFLAAARMNITEQTLTTYENGTRGMGLARLFELCRAFDITPGTLLDEAYHQTVGTNDATQIDLSLLAQSVDARLRPLRQWARVRVNSSCANEATVVPFTTEALDLMADLCGMDKAQLIDALAKNRAYSHIA